MMHSEVMEKGIMPVDDHGEVDTKHEIKLESKVVLAPEDGLERAKQILRVIEAIVARNNSKDFAGGGHPSAKAVSAALGWMTDQKEVSGVWKKHRETLLTEK